VDKGKLALVTGAHGQDGGYLCRFLVDKGYRVIGTSRVDRATGSTCEPGADIRWVQWDGLGQDVPRALFGSVEIDECYNLAAHASGSGMYEQPEAVGEINGLAVTRLLEVIRQASPRTRFVQASSAEVFGCPQASPQDESSIRRPRSPYGAAKLYADAMVDIYRSRYGIHASSAILYNHESPRRGVEFLTRKVARAAAAISLGRAESVSLGNLDARRDWGYAGDYVRAMWMMAQASGPDDYVIATGDSHSVRDVCAIAFRRVGLDDPAAFRPAEPVPLVGSPGKIRRKLGWAPQVDFEALVEMMVDHDLADLQSQTNAGVAE
jgi:GDPmannose 4,6-dehydratase